MKLLVFFVFCGVVVGLLCEQLDNEQKTKCLKGCRCTNKRIRCNGRSIAHVVSTLPNDTESFLYNAHDPVIQLGNVDFSHLRSLITLVIKSAHDEYHLTRFVSLDPSRQVVFKPLHNLTALAIRTNWNMSQPMPEMFSYLPRLRVLDLTYTRYMNYTSLQKSFQGLQRNHTLSSLILKNTQTFQGLQNGMFLNLSSFLEPLAHCPLKYVDLSYNSLKTVYPGLIRFAPKLKKLDFTNNMLAPLVTSAFFYEVILHPTLEEADFRRQGHGANFPDTPPEPNHGEIPENPSKTIDKTTVETKSLRGARFIPQVLTDVYKSSLTTMLTSPQLVLPRTFSLKDTSCLSAVRKDLCKIFMPNCSEVLKKFHASHDDFCHVFEKMFEESFGGIPCEYFPNVTDLLATEKECGGCFRFPSAGNLRKLILSEYVYYDQSTMSPRLIHNTKCFIPNKIEVLDISINYPLGFPDMFKSVLTPVKGFSNLKEANLASCGLKRLYYNFSASFQSIEVLDLSNNKLNLESAPRVSYFLGPPTIKVFRLTGNGFHWTPHRTLQTMTALQELHIDQNHLQEFTMDLTKLPHLVKLNLRGNSIKSISKNMMAQFDAHAQRINRSVEIDLRENQLLCTCYERDFVRWLQGEKHRNLHFVGISSVQCLDDQADSSYILEVNLNAMALRCLSGEVIAAISAAGGLLLAGLIVTCGTCVYRKRWWFRYRYYIVTNFYRQQQQREENRRDYQYDAFVSYNSRDELWINEKLQPKLEDELGLKLCLHERDFAFGVNIFEQISASIENSRKTLLILSPNFLASTWCHWEMNLAHNRLLSSGQDVLLLAILSPMSKVKMSRVLKDLLETKTYVMWTEDPDGQKLFWEKLHRAIRADRLEPYDLEDEQPWEETQPLLVNGETRVTT